MQIPLLTFSELVGELTGDGNNYDDSIKTLAQILRSFYTAGQDHLNLELMNNIDRQSSLNLIK